MRRYQMILQLAEFPGDRSHCPTCEAGARFNLLHTGPREEAARHAHRLACR